MYTWRAFVSAGACSLSALSLAFGAAPLIAGPEKAGSVPGLPCGAEGAAEWKTGARCRPMPGVPIENFGVVAPGCLYRSAQPGSGDYAWLAKQGFKSVISLRLEKKPDEDHINSVGLKSLHISVRDYGIPTDDQVRTFLEFIRQPENRPALVHCAGGQGRAAIFSAIARYSIDGWSMSDALHEARYYRPFKFRMYGEQRRFLNAWKDRFPPGSYHPVKDLPEWKPAVAKVGADRS
jgi:protein tyrosine phosphatase (PTP) superfamily phosphohydrolase (DUF442 family)